MGKIISAGVGLLILAQTVLTAKGASSSNNVVDGDRRFLEELEKSSKPPEPVAQKAELPIDQETVGNFLQAYVQASTQKNPRVERSYFGDSVVYYNRGTISQKALESELAKGHERNESVTWMGLQGVSASGPNAVRARFTVRKGSKRSEIEVREATIVRLPKGGLRMTQLQKAPPIDGGNPRNLP